MEDLKEGDEKIKSGSSRREVKREIRNVNGPDRFDKIAEVPFFALISSTILKMRVMTTDRREKTMNWEMTRKANSRVRTVRSVSDLDVYSSERGRRRKSG
jgi:hypothetical protein